MIACSKSITIYIRLIVGLALSGVSKVNSVYSIMTYIRKNCCKEFCYLPMSRLVNLHVSLIFFHSMTVNRKSVLNLKKPQKQQKTTNPHFRVGHFFACYC